MVRKNTAVNVTSVSNRYDENEALQGRELKNSSGRRM